MWNFASVLTSVAFNALSFRNSAMCQKSQTYTWSNKNWASVWLGQFAYLSPNFYTGSKSVNLAFEALMKQVKATYLNVKPTLEAPNDSLSIWFRLLSRDAETLFFCGTPTPGLEYLGLLTPTLALKTWTLTSSQGLIVWHNDCVLKDELLEILNSSNKKCTIV